MAGGNHRLHHANRFPSTRPRAERLAIIRAIEIFKAPPVSAQSASQRETATGAQTHRRSCGEVDYVGPAAKPRVGPPAPLPAKGGHSNGVGQLSLDQVERHRNGRAAVEDQPGHHDRQQPSAERVVDRGPDGQEGQHGDHAVGREGQVEAAIVSQQRVEGVLGSPDDDYYRGGQPGPANAPFQPWQQDAQVRDRLGKLGEQRADQDAKTLAQTGTSTMANIGRVASP